MTRNSYVLAAPMVQHARPALDKAGGDPAAAAVNGAFGLPIGWLLVGLIVMSAVVGLVCCSSLESVESPRPKRNLAAAPRKGAARPVDPKGVAFSSPSGHLEIPSVSMHGNAVDATFRRSLASTSVLQNGPSRPETAYTQARTISAASGMTHASLFRTVPEDKEAYFNDEEDYYNDPSTHRTYRSHATAPGQRSGSGTTVMSGMTGKSKWGRGKSVSTPGNWSRKLLAALHLTPGEEVPPTPIHYTRPRPPRAQRFVGVMWWTKLTNWKPQPYRDMDADLSVTGRRLTGYTQDDDPSYGASHRSPSGGPLHAGPVQNVLALESDTPLSTDSRGALLQGLRILSVAADTELDDDLLQSRLTANIASKAVKHQQQAATAAAQQSALKAAGAALGFTDIHAHAHSSAHPHLPPVSHQPVPLDGRGAADRSGTPHGDFHYSLSASDAERWPAAAAPSGQSGYAAPNLPVSQHAATVPSGPHLHRAVSHLPDIFSANQSQVYTGPPAGIHHPPYHTPALPHLGAHHRVTASGVAAATTAAHAASAASATNPAPAVLPVSTGTTNNGSGGNSSLAVDAREAVRFGDDTYTPAAPHAYNAGAAAANSSLRSGQAFYDTPKSDDSDTFYSVVDESHHNDRSWHGHDRSYRSNDRSHHSQDRSNTGNKGFLAHYPPDRSNHGPPGGQTGAHPLQPPPPAAIEWQASQPYMLPSSKQRSLEQGNLMVSGSTHGDYAMHGGPQHGVGHEFDDACMPGSVHGGISKQALLR